MSMKNKPLSLKIIVWIEIVVAARMLLFEVPIAAARMLHATPVKANDYGTFISLMISVPALFYVVVGILTLMNHRYWRQLQYLVTIVTVLLNVSLIYFLKNENVTVYWQYYLPSFFSVLIFMYMLIRGGVTVKKNKRILVVDDEKSQLEMMDPLLSTQGFDVTLASSGEEGLRLAQKYLPDLIILDVIMPGIKGREVCIKLKEDDLTKDIPVLFLTSKNSPDDVEAELKVGAIGHFTKPINSSLLIGEIKRILHVHK